MKSAMGKEPLINILVVDDEQIVLDSVKKHLRGQDLTIHTAASAEEGLVILDRETIDFVLTDLMMPKVDGMEFMKMAHEKRPSLPMIMMTGYATISTALQATQMGAFAYIAKPFSRSELQEVVTRAVAEAERLAAEQGPTEA